MFYLKGSGEPFTEGIKDGAALVQFELTRVLTEIFSHRLSDLVQCLAGGLRFSDPGLSMLITTAGNTDYFFKPTKHIPISSKFRTKCPIVLNLIPQTANAFSQLTCLVAQQLLQKVV